MTKTQIAIVTTTLLAGAASLRAQTPAPAPAPKPMAPAAAPAPKPAAPPAAAAPKPAAGAPAAAAPATPPGPPKPSKELEAFMKPFEGSWKCETKFAANAFGPGSPEVTAKSSVKFKKDFDGHFYRGEYEIKKQKGVEMPMKGIFYIGYDSGSNQVVVTGVDSTGGVGMGVGKITGDSVTYTGDQYSMGMKMKTRETMQMKGKEGYHKLEMDMGKGFMTFGEDTCKK